MEFVRDFNEVYRAINEEIALENLTELEEKWGSKYPFAIKSWEMNWDVLSPFFKYPEKIKTMFPSDQSLEKMLYLASQNVMKKWTQRYKNWDAYLTN